jgi:hypothetical protein
VTVAKTETKCLGGVSPPSPKGRAERELKRKKMFNMVEKNKNEENDRNNFRYGVSISDSI